MLENEKQEIREIAEVFKDGPEYMRGKIAGYAEALQMLRPVAPAPVPEDKKDREESA